MPDCACGEYQKEPEEILVGMRCKGVGDAVPGVTGEEVTAEEFEQRPEEGRDCPDGYALIAQLGEYQDEGCRVQREVEQQEGGAGGGDGKHPLVVVPERAGEAEEHGHGGPARAGGRLREAHERDQREGREEREGEGREGKGEADRSE